MPAAATVETPPAADTPATFTPPAETPPAAAVPAVDTPAVTPAPAPPAPGTPAAEPAKGVPETYALTQPDGQPLTGDYLAYVTTTAKALGLTNEQAQTLVKQQHDEMTTVAAQYERDAKADPDLGGDKYAASVTRAQEGLRHAMQQAKLPADEIALITHAFDVSGMGNHKAFLRLFAWLGHALHEDSHVTPGLRPASERRESKDVLYAGTTSKT